MATRHGAISLAFRIRCASTASAGTRPCGTSSRKGVAPALHQETRKQDTKTLLGGRRWGTSTFQAGPLARTARRTPVRPRTGRSALAQDALLGGGVHNPGKLVAVVGDRGPDGARVENIRFSCAPVPRTHHGPGVGCVCLDVGGVVRGQPTVRGVVLRKRTAAGLEHVPPTRGCTNREEGATRIIPPSTACATITMVVVFVPGLGPGPAGRDPDGDNPVGGRASMLRRWSVGRNACRLDGSSIGTVPRSLVPTGSRAWHR